MKLHQFDSDWFQCFFWPVWPMTIQISIRIEAVIFSLAMIKSIWTSYEGWHFWFILDYFLSFLLFPVIFLLFSIISCHFLWISIIFYRFLSFCFMSQSEAAGDQHIFHEADNCSAKLTYSNLTQLEADIFFVARMRLTHFNLNWRLTIILWGWHIWIWTGCWQSIHGGCHIIERIRLTYFNLNWGLTIILWGWHTFQFGLEADTFTSGQGADNHSVRLTISIWTGCNLYQSLQTVSNWLGLNHGSVWNPTIFIRLLSIPWLLWQILYKIDGNYLLHDPFGLSDYVQINEIISLDDAHEPQSPSPNSKTSISAAL